MERAYRLNRPRRWRRLLLPAAFLLFSACSQDAADQAPAVSNPHAADSPLQQAKDLVGSDLPAAGHSKDEQPQPDPTEAKSPTESSGKNVYLGNCKACHDQGIAGAPKLGDAEAWEDRLEKGLDTLVRHAIEGFKGTSGFMPARGGNAKLSNEEVAAAVSFMVDAVRPPGQNP